MKITNLFFVLGLGLMNSKAHGACYPNSAAIKNSQVQIVCVNNFDISADAKDVSITLFLKSRKTIRLTGLKQESEDGRPLTYQIYYLTMSLDPTFAGAFETKVTYEYRYENERWYGSFEGSLGQTETSNYKFFVEGIASEP